MRHTRKLENLFSLFGACIFDNRWTVVIVSFLINGLFGLGLLSLSLNNDPETLFLNRNTETKELEVKLSELYRNTNNDQFAAHSSIKLPEFVEIIVSGKENNNLIDPIYINATNTLLEQIQNISITSEYKGLISYKDLCGQKSGKCVIEGYEIVESLSDCSNKQQECFLNISQLEGQYSTETYESIIEKIGNYTESNGIITDAGYFKFKLFLRQNTAGVLKDSKLWRHQFIQKMSNMSNDHLDIVYAHSMSLIKELDEDTYPDINYFGLAFTIVLVYLGFYLSGGDCVSKRIHLGRMGTIVGPLSVLGAWGLICGSGWQFTNTVGVMPFFVVYYELNNVLITMGKVTDCEAGESARDRIRRALGATGVPVTITTISYVTAFVVGTQSGYLAMQIVSIYTVGTVCFVYVNHMTFFIACLAIHEQRIDQNRHCCTCQEVQPRTEVATNRSCCFICCCTGDGSKAKENVSSTLEKISRMLVSYFVLRSCFKMLVLLLFLSFTGFSIWKTFSFTCGLYKPELLTRNSYYRKFAEINDREFTSDFYVTFVVPGITLYETRDLNFKKILKEKLAANDNIDPDIFIPWSKMYEKFLNTSDSLNGTFGNQISTFLSSHSQFKNDFAFDKDGTIISLRVYVKTRNVRTMDDILVLKQSLLRDNNISDSVADLEKNIHMTQQFPKMSDTDKLQNIRDRLALTLYAPMFIFVDKYTTPLIESIIQIGVLIATNLILTTIVCPNLRLVVIQPFNFATTLVGLFGMMSAFGVEMTSFSMIVVVLGISYVADINTHMLYSFHTTVGTDRQSRAHAVLTTTSIIYFNTILASVVGLLALFLVKSYIFVTVMKILMITLILCFIQSVLIYPIVLSLLGPNIRQDDLIGKRVAAPKIHVGKDSNEIKHSDRKSNYACDNLTFNKEIAEPDIQWVLDGVTDSNPQANYECDNASFSQGIDEPHRYTRM